MAVPQRRTSKTRKRMRRTHFKLAVKGLVKCPNCGAMIKAHNVCPKCGYVLKPFLKQIGTEIYRCKKTLIEWCKNIFRSIKEKKQQRKANRDIKYYKNWITTKKVLRNISVFCVFTSTYAGVESAKTGASHIGLFLFWMLPAIFMGVLSLIIQYKLEQDIPEDIANELKFKNIFNTQEKNLWKFIRMQLLLLMQKALQLMQIQ